MSMPLPPRVPWPADFPEVIVHGDEKARDAHPCYLAAKSGDARSALTLAMDFLDSEKVQQIGEICRKANAWILAVSADEAVGYNVIPDAMAAVIGQATNSPVEENDKIVQINKVSHTRAPGFQRIVTPAAFTGTIVAGRTYFLVDDHAGFGGTFASLHGYICQNGGRVIDLRL
jgi:hypothetical protein